MATEWSVEQVLALAPDPTSAKAGKGLNHTKKWQMLGYTDTSVWGACQGSGSQPYQVRIALNEPAFKCSCPSRKFPCKHSIGLFLLFVEQRSAFQQVAPPDWVSDWLESRVKIHKKREEKANNPSVVDTVAQVKRVEKREAKVQLGLQELSLWLQEIVRTGLGDLQNKPYQFFEGVATRMVDAQASGLASRVRLLASIANSGKRDWVSILLDNLARLHLLLESYPRLSLLSTDLQSDIRQLIGWTQTKEEILQLPAVKDHWLALGQWTDNEDTAGLIKQTIWLHGTQTGRMALLLNFAHQTAITTLDHGWRTGLETEAELCFYPSAVPLRAVVKNRYETRALSGLQGFLDWQTAFATYKKALIELPWLERFPMIVENVSLAKQGKSWWLVDDQNKALPLTSTPQQLWKLLAISAGNPITLFGEYQESIFHPYGICPPPQSEYISLYPL